MVARNSVFFCFVQINTNELNEIKKANKYKLYLSGIRGDVLRTLSICINSLYAAQIMMDIWVLQSVNLITIKFMYDKIALFDSIIGGKIKEKDT